VQHVTSAHRWTAAELPRLDGRRFVITGASSGIGLAAATQFAAKGAHVVLAVRDTAKGAQAATKLAGDTEVRRLDLADLASVRAFAHDLAGTRIDVLINNAGVMNTPLTRTADGFELQFGTNHLGHFALTNLLLPQLTDRVVVIASGAHRSASLDFDDLNSERRYQRHRTYGRTKLANLLFASELNRRLKAAGSAVKALSAHPGLVATNLQKPTGNRLEDGLIAVGVRLLAQNSDRGALPTLYAATQDLPGDSYVGPDGLFGMRGYPGLVDRSDAANDAETARRLWDESERLTGIRFPREGLATV
jgi:NAD(P)-dependent dehydrogenase (short-subunit alcohol dehydrogenase family)